VGSERDPRAPVFFLSYARPPRLTRHSGTPSESPVSRFFDDLSENVAALVPRPAGAGADPGFMDSRMSGVLWEPELLDMLGNCQSFVALLSASYIESEWCAREWHAFSRRTIRKTDPSASDNHRAIFPVIWAPVRKEQIPEVISSAQRFSPDDEYARTYAENGIFGLLRINRDAYEMTVWRLAQRIADSYYCYDTAPLIVEHSELRDIFRK
jgi:hypothetical protein